VNTKRIFGSTGRYYLARASVFLLSVALIIGMASCGPVTQYSLTISSTEGGEVTHPGEGTFTYNEGTVVDLVAEADDGYLFADWTGDVGTVADVNAGSTTITMSGNYTVTANFTPEASQNLEIRTWYDLDAVRHNLGGNHTLLNDLDSTTAGYEELASVTANEGKGWEPIGYGEWDYPEQQWIGEVFVGSLNGQGHNIRDLFINRPDESTVGLFGVQDGLISNICLTNMNVLGGDHVGGLVGWNRGTVNNSPSDGNVVGDYYVGGLLGYSSGDVSNSCFSGRVSGCWTIGGLVGRNWGIIGSSYSSGNVSGLGSVIGGLVGDNRATIGSSYSSGNVSGLEAVGGLVGYHTFGLVIGGVFMADLIGANASPIPYVVSDCYATGSVTGTSYVGGLVGYTYYGTVLDSYSAGSVSGDSSVGGLVGFDYWGCPAVGDSLWDIDASGQATSAGGTGMNTTEMKNIATFTDVATEGLDEPWDMIAVASSVERNPSYIWNIVDGVTYPFLSWQSI
jgi:uncharacterized repeat protein (TIGR02543 family)